MIDRFARMGPPLVGWFAGASQVETSLPLSHHAWLGWVAASLAAVAAVRVGVLTFGTGAPARERVARASFAWYLLGVGAVAIAAFLASKPTLVGYSRYAILGLLVPIGLSGTLFALEPSRIGRTILAAAIVFWAVLSTADNARLLITLWREPPADQVRELAQRLVDERIPVAAGNYWEAYTTTFVARERVRVTSEFVRIQEYQDLFAEHLSDARVLAHAPCPGGERVARWFLCKP
jgi:hypothetical protein